MERTVELIFEVGHYVLEEIDDGIFQTLDTVLVLIPLLKHRREPMIKNTNFQHIHGKKQIHPGPTQKGHTKIQLQRSRSTAQHTCFANRGAARYSRQLSLPRHVVHQPGTSNVRLGGVLQQIKEHLLLSTRMRRTRMRRTRMSRAMRSHLVHQQLQHGGRQRHSPRAACLATKPSVLT